MLPEAESKSQYFEACFSEIQKLPYLDACVKEAFRMHPAPSFDMERVVPPEGALICDERIPGGTIVSCNPWVIHRSMAIFGDDVEVYRPERWLEDPEKAKVMNSTLFQFGHGARTCIGKKISTMEMYKLIPPVFKTFEVSLSISPRYRLLTLSFVGDVG
jgi:cytochrome P450